MLLCPLTAVSTTFENLKRFFQPLSGSRVGTACTTNKLALFSLCCGQRTAAVSPPGLLTDRSGTTSNEPGKSTIHTSEEMEGLLKAIQDLESSLGNAKNEAVRQHLQSACAVMRNAVEDHRGPVVDQLARLTALPEAIVSCRPPSVALSGSSAKEPSEGLSPLPPPLDGALAEEVKTWSFDIHKIAAAELPTLCFGVMMQHPAVTRVLPQLSLHRLWRFVQVVGSRYRDNPFHSFRHAVDVTLGISCLLRWLQEAQPTLLSDLQVVAALVAAMVHDTDHPGVMNNFLVATRHPLAVLYNQQSVLENHHIATAMALASRPELDWISPLPASEQAELRKVMIELVLATDPTTHMPFMKRFMEDVAAQTVTPMQAMAAMLKGADISNPTRPLSVYAVWVEGIMKEFFAQGDAERTLGLPISMNCDRESVNVNKCQVGFITFLVSPIWKGIAQLIPAQGPQLLAELETNLEHYKALAA